MVLVCRLDHTDAGTQQRYGGQRARSIRDTHGRPVGKRPIFPRLKGQGSERRQGSPNRRNFANSSGREAPLASGESIHGLAFSPDGRRIAVATGNLVIGEGGTVTVWDVATGEKLLTLQVPNGAAFDVAFSPDGKFMASGAATFRGEEGEVRVWSAVSGELVHTLRGHTGPIGTLVFSPDSRRLASAGRDKKIKIWDVTTGLEAITLHGHIDTVWAMAFSPDGHLLASPSADQTVRIWDATPLEQERGAELETLVGHKGQVNSVAFSADSRYLATAGADRIVRVWDAKTRKKTHE